MKTLFRYTAVISILFLLGGCKKYLDVKPKEYVPDDQTIFDNLSASNALRGTYNALAHENYYGTTFQAIGYLSGDNVVWSGSQSIVDEFIKHRVNSDNSYLNLAWIAIYRTVNRANNVIEKVPAIGNTAELNQYIGEAHFLRALAYFDLARTWGGVPIITKPTILSTDNLNVQRSSLDETYAQVLKDLEKAETLLPATPAVLTANDRYRASRKAVWALKARYYLYRNDWAKAEEYATKVITDASFKLVTPYGAFFAGNVRGTTESVFEIFYNGTSEVNVHRNQWQPQTAGGTRQWAPSNAFITLDTNKNIGGNRNVLVAKDNQNRWYGNLYYRSPASDPGFVIRIAELFLIRAEARAQQDLLDSGLADLNEIRKRAAIAQYVIADVTSKEDLLLKIENERRIEFAFEPHRWFDLVRTGRAATVLKVNEPFRLLLPVPIEQLRTDKALTQNPGY